MSKIEILTEAILNKEHVQIKYNGGSQPGSIREILPLKFIKDMLMAKCVATGAQKTFTIDKIELLDHNNVDAKSFDPSLIGLRMYDSMQDFYTESKQYFDSIGWDYTFIDDELKLYFTKKDGRKIIRKQVTMNYYPLKDDPWSNDQVPNPKPYWVSGGNYNTVCYGKLDKAVTSFIERADDSLPL